MNTSTHPPAGTDVPDSANSVQAVVFALRILEHVASSRDAQRVTDLAAHFGTNKTRIFRHLRTLVENGYIVQDAESERYRVGSRLIALGQTVSRNFDLSSVAQPAMRALRDSLNHSVVLGLPASDGVHVVSVEPSAAPFEITVRPGSVLRLHNSAQGKVALAFGDPAVLEALQAADIPASTPLTLSTPAALREAIAQVRAQGWAEAPNEAAMGLNAVAAPVMDAGGQMIATVAIVNLVQFLSDATTVNGTGAPALMKCAADISARLGYRGRMYDEYRAAAPKHDGAPTS